MAKVSKSRGRNDGQPPVDPDIDFEKLLAEARQKIPEISWPDNFGDNDPDIKAITDFLRATERGELANLDSPGDSKRKKVAARMRPSLELWGKQQASEGLINDKKSDTKRASEAFRETTLPDVPPALWPGRSRGRPRPGMPDPLLAFLEETYGPYFPHFRNKLRAYIHRHDRKLYRAITDYEQNRKLPDHLAMPSAPELVEERIQTAARGNYQNLTLTERHSVRRATKRRLKPPSQ